nr:MAG TPA: Proto-chlorophyllide reductase 57 kD subunit [Caudoviricetes sp.]
MSHLNVITCIKRHSRPNQTTPAAILRLHRIPQFIRPIMRTIHQPHVTILKLGRKHGNNLINHHHQTPPSSNGKRTLTTPFKKPVFRYLKTGFLNGVVKVRLPFEEGGVW